MRPYDGPFPVLARSEKHFDILRNNKTVRVDSNPPIPSLTNSSPILTFLPPLPITQGCWTLLPLAGSFLLIPPVLFPAPREVRTIFSQVPTSRNILYLQPHHLPSKQDRAELYSNLQDSELPFMFDPFDFCSFFFLLPFLSKNATF